MIRWLARRNTPEQKATELDWINREVRLLGKSYGRASRSIKEEIERGTMIVVEPPKDHSK